MNRLILIVCALAVACGQPRTETSEKRPCLTAADCSAGESCDAVTSQCATSVATGGAPAHCHQDQQCAFGMVCGLPDGLCVVKVCFVSSDCGPSQLCNSSGACEPRGCAVDPQCPSSSHCDIGRCHAETCDADSDCASDHHCSMQTRRCEPRTCGHDSQCPSDCHCVGGRCQQFKCAKDADCAAGEVCQPNGECKKRDDDCHHDGGMGGGGGYDDDDDDDDGDQGGKVKICHVPPGNPGNRHTIEVGASAVPAHLAHGDYLGACQAGGPGMSCGSDAACPSGHYCSHQTHSCKPVSCSKDSDCGSGHKCKDGKCKQKHDDDDDDDDDDDE